MDTVSFIEMKHGTAEDYALLDRIERGFKQAHHIDSVLAMFKQLDVPGSGYKISRYEHSLQSATRAHRDGQSEEMVVAALLHDIGDTLAPDNHSELAAAILQPYVGEETHWIIKHHGIFQGIYFWHHLGADRNARERYRGHQYFDACANFCERYDQNCFDPAYENMPLEAFVPMVQRVFSRPAYAIG